MLKYVNWDIVFAEIPDEITLAINISGCPNRCPGCHSQYLLKDIGSELTESAITDMITKSSGITCVSFMGGDAEPWVINKLAKFIKTNFSLKVAWYSGKSEISKDIFLDNFDYIKVGPYVESRGPLNDINTNQRLFKISNKSLEDITNKFWNQHEYRSGR